MARLTIPDVYVPGFELIADLEDATVDALLAAVRQAETILDISSLTHRAVVDEAGLPDDDAHAIVNSLISLYHHGMLTDETTQELAEEASESDKLDLSPSQREQLRDRLSRLLSSKAIWLTAKATNLLADHENVISGTRIISDTRFLFEDEDGLGPPQGAVLYHSLKLEYRSAGSGYKSAYFAMDDQDLKDLAKHVARALDKADLIHDALGGLDLPWLETTEEEH